MIPRLHSKKANQVRDVASIFPGVRLDDLRKEAEVKWHLSQYQREGQGGYWITMIWEGGKEWAVRIFELKQKVTLHLVCNRLVIAENETVHLYLKVTGIAVDQFKHWSKWERMI